MKETIIRFLKPRIYIVENIKFLGNFVTALKNYETNKNGITYLSPNQEQRFVTYSETFFLKWNAKKEMKKYAIPYPEKHIKLLKAFKKAGIQMTETEERHLLEDGEYSEIYEKYSEAFDTQK